MYTLTELFTLFLQVSGLLVAIIFLFVKTTNRIEKIQRAQYFSNNPEELETELASGLEQEIEEQVDELLKKE